MAFQTLPGTPGYIYARKSSFDNRAIGKLTDANHLMSASHGVQPADYDKKIIDIYTQSSLYSNDFLNMINQTTPFYIEGNTDSWKWDITVPYKFPVIVAMTSDTAAMARPGIDGQEFTMVLSTDEFYEKEVITGHKIYGPNLLIVKDAVPYNGAFMYSVTLLSLSPTSEFVDKSWLQPGIEYQKVNELVGEFDQDLPGLGRLGERITMYDSLGAAVGVKHGITAWADDIDLVEPGTNNPMDLIVFAPDQRRRNGQSVTQQAIRWEPFIETQLRMKMMSTKVEKMIWSKPGTGKTGGSRQELKKASAGVYYRMRNNGNLVQYNAGQFTTNIFRSVFGDLFYRRVDVANRRVKIYTNEAGFDVFDQAAKDDAINSGLTLVAGVNDKFIQGSGQQLTFNYAFNSIVTRETGRIELVHLKELDLPQSNLEFGSNKKSTPIFLVFDISPNGDGSMKNNIREVRLKGRPSMTWGYIDGRRSHLGFAASKGFQAANMFNGYEIFMDDRYDVFIEDLSRCVVIEQVPQY